MAGVPIPYDSYVAAHILERLANGETLKAIFKNPLLPNISVIYRWQREQPDFYRAWQVARAQGADMIADEIVDIADNATDSSKARNQIEARKWLAGVLNPRYSPRVDVNITERVDLTGAREAALQRLSRPVRDQLTSAINQRIENAIKPTIEATDKQSDGETE